MSNNFILALCGKSGCGKSTVEKELKALYGWKSVNSYTTRKPRFEGETGHLFISDSDFDKIREEDIMAYTEFDGNRYCSTSEQINDSQIYVIDPYGIEVLRNRYKGHKKIIVVYLYANDDILVSRMKKRGDTIDRIKKRVENDKSSFCNVVFDYSIDTSNKNPTVVAEEIYKFIDSYNGI